MRKIKILRIIARLNIGGPAIHTILLAEGLDKDRFESLLVCGEISKDEGDMSYYARQKNVEPYFIPELKRELNIFNDIAAFKKIYRLIQSEEPDIIHTHTAKAGSLGRSAAILYNFVNILKGKRVKLIHTFHGHVFEGYFGRLKTFLFIIIERILGFFTYKIITVSESVKKELIFFDITKESKIEVIPLGFELDRFLNILPKDDNSVLSVGIVGRLIPIKNHRLFLQAAAKVIKRGVSANLRFKVIGDGQLRQELEGFSRQLGIEAQVDFLGWRKDLVKVYSDLDAVVLTSINEGTPVSLIEAMASAKPVIATDVGGVKDLFFKAGDYNMQSQAGIKVYDNGILCESGNISGVAEALRLLLDNARLRKTMGENGRGFVRGRFSKERLIKDIELLYNNSLKC